MQHQQSILEKIRRLNNTQKALLALVLILPAPLIGITASLHLPLFEHLSIGQVIWFLMKIWIILMPTLWLLYIDKGKLSWSRTNWKGIGTGFLWSIPVCSIIVGVYWLAGNTLIDSNAKEKIDELGIASPWLFLLFATFMSIVNSLMEEYIWRWFVFSKFKVLVGAKFAIVCSAFFFTLHHVVIMWTFGSLQLVVVGSIGLFLGAIIWGWLYQKYNSIWPGWICHIAADTAIMWIVWTIITGK